MAEKDAKEKSLADSIHQDMIAAMRAREELRLSTLRMMKSAIKSKEIDKRAPLEDSETLQILSTMIKQRKESIEQFNKGGRPELAAKEAAEIVIIEAYMPQSASAEQVAATVKATIAEMTASAAAAPTIAVPTMKDMGTVMKNAMAKFAAAGTRVDGKMVSEAVKKELTPK